MHIQEIDSEVYEAIFPKPPIVYNSVGFTGLNARKVAAVRRLAFVDGDEPQMGLTVGEKLDGTIAAPFSAPFASFDYNEEPGLEALKDAIKLLRGYLPGMSLTLPPALYAPSMITKTTQALIRSGGRLAYSDLNYHLDLSAKGGYDSLINSSRRTMVRRAAKEGLYLESATVERAYSIVKAHHQNKGYPVKMSLSDLTSTIGPGGPVYASSFVLTDGTTDYCAAIVYDSAPGVAQVIYWGDIPDNPLSCTMNLLAERLYNHYGSRGYRILDIGPSSEKGVPSEGLCAFKKSIGCILTPKPTFIL